MFRCKFYDGILRNFIQLYVKLLLTNRSVSEVMYYFVVVAPYVLHISYKLKKFNMELKLALLLCTKRPVPKRK